MSNRSPEVQAAYRKHLASYDGFCAFCDHIHSTNDQQVASRYTNFTVIKNAFPYENWDTRKVKDHLMIIPNRHIIELNELNEAERTEYIDLLFEYENKGYSIYARSSKNATRTVAHQHTHCIDVGTEAVLH